MTNHVIADELFEGVYKLIRAAYREGEGNAAIRAECQHQVRMRAPVRVRMIAVRVCKSSAQARHLRGYSSSCLRHACAGFSRPDSLRNDESTVA